MVMTEQLEASVSSDSNYEAAVHLLTSPFLARKGCADFIQPTWIDADGLEEAMGPWSTTEKMMVHLALDLSERPGHAVSMDDMACYLDDANWRIVMEALEIRRSGLRDFGNEDNVRAAITEAIAAAEAER
jgi:hypothetical protein